jgi:acyl dehydratase
MADVDVAALRADWAGREFDTTEFVVDRQQMLDWAEACGETDPRFTDPGHPDFQAHPSFTTKYGSRRVLPEGFPPIGNGRGIDGGKAVEVTGTVRPGDVLTAHSQIADIYEKTGRSGTMVFIVHRMVFTNPAGEEVATVDWRMIRSVGDEP